MEATISLILSRHGETEENKLRIMQGQMPGHLSELGKQQAEQLADLLEEEEIDVMSAATWPGVTTPLWLLPAAKVGACPDTAAQRNGLGYLYREKWPMKWISRIWPESVESVEALYKRAGEFLQFLQTNFPGKRILAIGHGGFNRAIIVRIEKRQQEEILKLPIMKNTACLRFSL